jgi:RsmE family RNA methyltransferase
VNLILLDHDDTAADAGRVRLSDGRAAHLRRVLRVSEGQSVRIGRIDGPLGVGVVESIDGGSVTLRCAFEASVPPRPRVDVLLAVPRPKVLRRLWAQLAALGVGQIILTNAERVERPYFDTHLLGEATYRPLLIEGLQQARDTRLPIVSVHRQFRILVEDHLDALAGGSLRLLADPRGTTALAAAAERHEGRRLLLAIGPEGGWNAFELTLLQTHGFELVGLGPRTLRVDTACTAMLAIAHAAMRD